MTEERLECVLEPIICTACEGMCSVENLQEACMELLDFFF